MKGFDKNSLIGLLLIGLIFYFFGFFDPPASDINYIAKDDIVINDTVVEGNTNSNKFDKPKDVYETVNLLEEKSTEIKNYVLENDKIKVTISNKGGRIVSVIIKEGPNKKQYKTYDNKALEIFNADSSNFNLNFTTDVSIHTKRRFFQAINQNKNSITMRLALDTNRYIDFNYSINDDDYLVDYNINLSAIDELIKNNKMYLDWQMKTPQTEKSKSNQEMYTGIYYQSLSDKYNWEYLGYSSDKIEETENKVSSVVFQQQFFSSILIYKDGFLKESTLASTKEENSKYIKNLSAKLEVEKNDKLDFQFYFGPNHYKQLQTYNQDFETIIPLGWGIFGWVNKYIIINIFDFLSQFFDNYGLIILILTIIIKLALSPFTYKAYLSQAKMKVLKPEIDKITEKSKDKMKAQQETMSLYRKAGVNPMGGCLPMLFQFPILIAMFRFFPASIELRQESFLWATDLSSYDSIYDFPNGFEIPFYGDHISLFTLLMTISTILYTRMNSQMTTGPMAQMKWMMYLMPIIFLGFFNNYASALCYYYFIANMFTFSQQYFMKKLINEDAILAQLEENKKKPKKKSNFQKKLEEMQKKQEQKMKKR
ncbi:MAG: membrane protein insertase YidC [Flavobacteriales bacterium]|jgi:YidC/Oxa1 family membrane protein insertase|nr:membrane protein insertase YidC [Flavobacteriales bacterium]